MRLETTRLYIRLAEEADVLDIHRFLSDKNTMTFFVEGTYDLPQIREILTKNQTEHEHYVLVEKETNQVIGKLSFHPWFMEQTYEIGWIMNPEYSNKGYMTEAAKAVLTYGFDTLHLHRIIATCQPENIPSKRICEKLNMRLEGTFKQCIKAPDGTWWDELFYAILNEDYQKE